MNEEVENLINKMLPRELERVEKFISMLLNNKREQRKTNLEYLNCEKAIAVYVRNQGCESRYTQHYLNM